MSSRTSSWSILTTWPETRSPSLKTLMVFSAASNACSSPMSLIATWGCWCSCGEGSNWISNRSTLPVHRSTPRVEAPTGSPFHPGAHGIGPLTPLNEVRNVELTDTHNVYHPPEADAPKQGVRAVCARFLPVFLKEKKSVETRTLVHAINSVRESQACRQWLRAGIPVLVAVCLLVKLRDGVRPRSCRGTRPRFASGTLMSLRTTPHLRVRHQAYLGAG